MSSDTKKQPLQEQFTLPVKGSTITDNYRKLLGIFGNKINQVITSPQHLKIDDIYLLVINKK